MKSLRELLATSSAVRLVGVYDGLSASFAERTGAQALWASGLCISASKAMPDNEAITYESLVRRLEDIRRGSRLPILADGNAGFGDHHVLGHLIALLEQRCIDGIALEDKAFPRRNSFDGGALLLEQPQIFADKLEYAAKCRTGDLVLTARTEGFIAGECLPEVIERAELYCEAGADAVIVHSKSSDPGEVLAFGRAWRRPEPVIVIPTTYPRLSFTEAGAARISGIICANQMLRAAMLALEACAAHLVNADTIDGCTTPLAPLASLLDLVDTFDTHHKVPTDA